MSDDDYAAMLELASEMSLAEAMKFIRAESGVGLREAHFECLRSAPKFPGSKLAVSVLLYNAQRPRSGVRA